MLVKGLTQFGLCFEWLVGLTEFTVGLIEGNVREKEKRMPCSKAQGWCRWVESCQAAWRSEDCLVENLVVYTSDAEWSMLPPSFFWTSPHQVGVLALKGEIDSVEGRVLRFSFSSLLGKDHLLVRIYVSWGITQRGSPTFNKRMLFISGSLLIISIKSPQSTGDCNLCTVITCNIFPSVNMRAVLFFSPSFRFATRDGEFHLSTEGIWGDLTQHFYMSPHWHGYVI